MQASERGVAVIVGLCPGVTNDLLEPPHILGQPCRIDRRVLYERERLGASLDVVHQPEAVLTQRPHLRLVGLRVQAGDGEPQLFPGHVLFKPVQLAGDLRLRLPVELNDQDVRGIALQETNIPGEVDVTARLVDDDGADVLNRRRVVFQRRDRGLHRLVEAGEVQDGKSRVLGYRNQAPTCTSDGGQRARAPGRRSPPRRPLVAGAAALLFASTLDMRPAVRYLSRSQGRPSGAGTAIPLPLAHPPPCPT